VHHAATAVGSRLRIAHRGSCRNRTWRSPRSGRPPPMPPRPTHSAASPDNQALCLNGGANCIFGSNEVVNKGDLVFGFVRYNGNGNYVLSLGVHSSDERWGWSKTLTLTKGLKTYPFTAEWLMEAGSGDLANFGSVPFSQASYRTCTNPKLSGSSTPCPSNKTWRYALLNADWAWDTGDTIVSGVKSGGSNTGQFTVSSLP
jgi:Peptidase A4 family